MHKERIFQGAVDFVRADKLLNTIAVGECYPHKPVSGPLVLYGNGNLGKLAQAYCKVVGQTVVAHIELDEWADHPAVAVCVVSDRYVPIERALLNRGFTTVLPFYDLTEQFKHKHPLSNGWYADVINPVTAVVMARWNDDVSRAHHLQFIAWHKLREEWCFEEAPVVQNNRYLIPEVANVLDDDEVVFDASAPYDQRNIYYRTSGVEELRRFSSLDFASQLAEMDKWEVLTSSIASLDVTPTFIKFHLEGHELPVLKGAKSAPLWKQRPILVVTVYHNADGIWKTPLWLMDNLPDYVFLFRQHCWCGSNAVVYAIPKERIK